MNKAPALASRTETNALVELYSLIFLWGVGGVREGFGKEVAFEAP